MKIKKFLNNLGMSLLILLGLAVFLTLFAIAIALAPESTEMKLQRERWEQSPYGG